MIGETFTFRINQTMAAEDGKKILRCAYGKEFFELYHEWGYFQLCFKRNEWTFKYLQKIK